MKIKVIKLCWYKSLVDLLGKQDIPNVTSVQNKEFLYKLQHKIKRKHKNQNKEPVSQKTCKCKILLHSQPIGEFPSHVSFPAHSAVPSFLSLLLCFFSFACVSVPCFHLLTFLKMSYYIPSFPVGILPMSVLLVGNRPVVACRLTW